MDGKSWPASLLAGAMHAIMPRRRMRRKKRKIKGACTWPTKDLSDLVGVIAHNTVFREHFVSYPFSSVLFLPENKKVIVVDQ